MFRLIRLLGRDERGATAVEYVMLIVFVALAIAAGAQTLGTDIGNLFTTIGKNIAAATVPNP